MRHLQAGRRLWIFAALLLAVFTGIAFAGTFESFRFGVNARLVRRTPMPGTAWTAFIHFRRRHCAFVVADTMNSPSIAFDDATPRHSSTVNVFASMDSA